MVKDYNLKIKYKTWAINFKNLNVDLFNLNYQVMMHANLIQNFQDLIQKTIIATLNRLMKTFSPVFSLIKLGKIMLLQIFLN
jgi:hypothetical protein